MSINIRDFSISNYYQEMMQSTTDAEAKKVPAGKSTAGAVGV